MSREEMCPHDEVLRDHLQPMMAETLTQRRVAAVAFSYQGITFTVWWECGQV